MSSSTSITHKDKAKCRAKWRTHFLSIIDQRLLSADNPKLREAESYIEDLQNYGYGEQLRPDDKLIRWDLLFLLDQGLTMTLSHTYRPENLEQLLLICNITMQEFETQRRRDSLESEGVNPDNAVEVANYERMKSMSPDELNMEINRLEALLAESEQTS